MDPKTLPSDRGLAALPSELFRLIIQHLSEDRKTLRAISLACRMLQHEGQRQLYRKIRFLRRGPGTHIKFFKGILDNNRLALLVHEYSQDTFAHSQWGTLRDYLRRGLQAMVNLKVLQFLTVNDQPAADILRDCTFQLRSLVWWNSVDGHLSNFLLSQHSLQKLEVDWPEDKRDLIPRSFCPQLRVLCGDRGAMETFLPGREVISLHWMGPFVDDSAHRIRSVEHLLPCLSRIRFFSFGYPYTWSSFSSIIGLFPCVEVLELVFPDIDSHEELALPVLHHFKKLQILVLSRYTPITRYTPIPIDRYLQSINTVFKSCDTLKQIDFVLDPKNYQTYRWTAGSLDAQPTLTTWKEVHRWWHV